MTDDEIEAVARALRLSRMRTIRPAATETDLPYIDEVAPGIKKMYERDARAAIEALDRERSRK